MTGTLTGYAVHHTRKSWSSKCRKLMAGCFLSPHGLPQVHDDTKDGAGHQPIKRVTLRISKVRLECNASHLLWTRLQHPERDGDDDGTCFDCETLAAV